MSSTTVELYIKERGERTKSPWGCFLSRQERIHQLQRFFLAPTEALTHRHDTYIHKSVSLSSSLSPSLFPESSPHPCLPPYIKWCFWKTKRGEKKKKKRGDEWMGGWVDGRLTGEQGISPLPLFSFHGSIQTCHLVHSSSSRLLLVVVVNLFHRWLFSSCKERHGIRSPRHLLHELPQLLGTGDTAA